MVRRRPEAAAQGPSARRDLSAGNWLILVAVYVFTVSVIGATLIIWWSRRSAGMDASFEAILLWQALVYGSWVPFAMAAWDLLARNEGIRRGLTAAFALGLVAIPLHVYFATVVDQFFSPKIARLGFGASALARVPVDILIYTAIVAGLWAAIAHRRTARLQAALDVARTMQESSSPGEAPLLVSLGSRKVPVPLDAIEWLGAAGNYVVVNWAEREGLVRSSLQQMEDALDGRRFVRIHRSTIVNLAMVASASSLADGSWRLTMRSGTELVASRTYRDIILERLGRR